MKKNVSRFIAAFLAAAMNTGSLAPLPSAVPGISDLMLNASAEDLVSGDFTYTVSEDETGVTITGYTGTDTVVTIPDKIGGKPVTAIGSAAFSGHSSMTGITVPTSVTFIGAEAIPDYICYEADYLEAVIIPETVKSIGGKAFCFCRSLKELTLHEGLETLGHCCFTGTAVT